MANLVPIAHLTDTLEEMNLETLAASYYGWKLYRDRLTELIGHAEMAIRNHLEAREALEVLTEDYIVALTGGGFAYSYDVQKLEALKPFLQKGEWEQIVAEQPPIQPPPKINTNKLKSLMSKRGKGIQEIFEAATIVTPRANRLTVEPRSKDVPPTTDGA